MSNQLKYFALVIAGICISVKAISQSAGCPPPLINYTINCGDDSTQLIATSGFDTYSWAPVSGLSNPFVSNPMAFAGTATTYTLTTTTTSDLVFNGDFALGNTGFVTTLNFTSSYSPGNYYVAPTFFTTGYSTGDHTPTSDQMFMSVDGETSVGVLWEQSIAVIQPSTNFQFSFWATDGGTINPAIFEMHLIGNVTGDVIVATQTAYPGTGVWNWGQYVAPLWNSGANTSVILRVINLETNGYGNDFGLDDFSFVTNCTETAIVTVNSTSLVADFNFDTVCVGSATTFNNLSTGGATTWMWEFGDGSTSTAQNPTHVYASGGTYNVTLIGSNALCTDTLSQSIIVYQQPNASFTSDIVCFGTPSGFINTSTTIDGNIVGAWWNFADGTTSNVYNPNYIIGSGPGSSNVTLAIVTNYGCVDTVTQTVFTYPSPVAAFSYLQDEELLTVYFTDISIGGTQWNWSFGDAGTSNLQSPTHIYTDIGTYPVLLIVTNIHGCIDTAQQNIFFQGETTTYIPNAFTPNGNGLNDVFAPKLYGVIEFKMLIFNRWGNEIFETEDMNEGWNGRVNGVGEIVQQDVYVYKIFTKDLLRNDHSYIGKVTIVK